MENRKPEQDHSTLVKECRRRLAYLKQQRTTWDTHWKEVRDHIFPWAGSWLDSDQKNDGGKKTDPIVSTGREALGTLAAGMQGGLTPRSERWFGLRLGMDGQDDSDQPTKAWLDRCTSLILDILAQSNFYHVSSQMYEDLGLFGTACLYMEPYYKTVMTFRHVSVGEYWLDQDWHGQVDTVFREFVESAANLVAEFGEDRVSQRVRDMAAKPETRGEGVTVVHAVFPRKDAREGSKDPRLKKFASVYYEADGSDLDKPLRVSGYDALPYMVVRWSVQGSNVYGHSPAMYALADVKQAKDMLIDVADMVGMIARPPLQGPDTLADTPISIDPGSVLLYPSTGGSAGLAPIIGYQADAMKVYQVVQEVQNNIRNAFHYQTFMLFTGDESKSMTATEILERKQVRLMQLGPVLERLQTELLAPIIDSTFDRCFEVGILPEVPDTVPQGSPIDIRYTSALARAADLARVTNISQFLSTILPMAQLPGVLDNVDFDATVRSLADHLDVPPTLLRKQADVDALRRREAEAQAQAEQAMTMQQAAQTADTAAGAAQKMGSVSMDENSAYNQLMSALGGTA
jgi:hypothetical protein